MRFRFSPILAAIASLGSTLGRMAGIHIRPRATALPPPETIPYDFAVTGLRVHPTWHNDPQSQASILHHKTRAAMRRLLRASKPSASRYARTNPQLAPAPSDGKSTQLAQLGVIAAALLSVGCVTLEPDGFCVASKDGKYAVCVNPLTQPVSYVLKATTPGASPLALRYDSATRSYRGTLPNGDTAVYANGQLTTEPALPTSGKGTASTAP